MGDAVQHRRVHNEWNEVGSRIYAHCAKRHVWTGTGNCSRLEIAADHRKRRERLQPAARGCERSQVPLCDSKRRNRHHTAEPLNRLSCVRLRQLLGPLGNGDSLRRRHLREFSFFGLFFSLFFGFLGPQRTDRKILVAAGFAAVSGNGEAAPQESEVTVDALTRNALQFGVAADRTVRPERIAEAHGTGVKTSFAGDTAPGKDSKDTKDVVRKTLPPRAAHIYTFADWASHAGAALFQGRPTA